MLCNLSKYKKRHPTLAKPTCKIRSVQWEQGTESSTCHHFQATVVSLWTLTNSVTVTKTLSSWSQRLQNFALHEFFWNGNRGARDCLWVQDHDFLIAVFYHTICLNWLVELVDQVSLILSFILTLKCNPKIMQVTNTGAIPDCLTEWMVHKEIFWP